ncbi:succinate dehydrogenase assembly factor 4 [Azospirillum agricola]|uniref:succinate dehydrogenase assembly factor 4 n=1 Tax=Azospirillum agricola TaxID=1720247 RepID=UPI000A0EED09|nr:succinate dehydrogenase assembly factor 4 [Azospirillum agricola]SMH56518.1 Protein of unknown function [Azospirillum lipoferum]
MTDKTPAAPAPAAPTPLPVDPKADATTPPAGTASDASALTGPEQKPGEIGGPQGPEPTRYGDWEFKGRCSDF